MRIGVVGGGPAGIVSAIVVGVALRGQGRPVAVDIFDSDNLFKGRAFNTGSTSMLLNTSVVFSSIDPANPREFMEYLQRQEALHVSLGDVVPRDAARRYLHAKFIEAGRTVDFRTIFALVENVTVDAQARPQFHSSIGIETYDAAILATGLNFRGPPPAFAGVETITPYPGERLAGIDKDAPILLLGSRLSAVDALVCLAANGHRGPIHFHSRSGLFPAVRRLTIKPQRRPLLESYLALERNLAPTQSKSVLFIELLERHIESAGMRLTDFIPSADTEGRAQLSYEIRLCEESRNVWEPVVADIVDALNHMWPELTTEEKSRFHREVGVWLGRLISSIPLRNALIVQRLFDDGQLRPANTNELAAASECYRHVINATGLLPADADPLLKRMADCELLCFNGGGGVTIEASSHRIRSNVPIYANGSITQGDVFTANSVYSSVHGAQRIANDLCHGRELPRAEGAGAGTLLLADGV